MKHPHWCKWTQTEDGVYETDCGRLFELTNGSPKENSLLYCAYCGGRLKEKPYGKKAIKHAK